MSHRFTHVTGTSLAKTLAFKFIPLADRLRDLNTRFGLRPYVVSIIHTKWAGGRRGQGVEEVSSVLLIEPTPKVASMTSLAEIVHPIGLDEVGGISVSEISGRYTEYQLRGFDSKGNPPGADETVFWEIEFPVPGDADSFRRRFTLSSVPMYQAGKLQWNVNLEKSHNDRTRSGDLR
jgi:hypothetical protein